tara:strand:+ start:731 stop:928 length:198 start_codon:yes stop_codon:yes gene_type:complete
MDKTKNLYSITRNKMKNISLSVPTYSCLEFIAKKHNLTVQKFLDKWAIQEYSDYQRPTSAFKKLV